MLIAAANQQPRAPSCEQECPNVAPKSLSPPLGRFFMLSGSGLISRDEHRRLFVRGAQSRQQYILGSCSLRRRH